MKEADKHRMMAMDPKWIPTIKGRDRSKVSYHLSEMYSPWSTWDDLVLKFKEANANAKIGIFDKLQNFVNSSLAQPWEAPVDKQKTEDEIIRLKDDRPAGTVHPETLMVTAGVDTQDNGFWYVIRGWGENMQSWLIRYGFVLNTDDLDQVLLRDRYTDMQGREYIVNLAVIDAMGHRTSEIYDYCRGRRGFLPAKGEQRMANPHAISKIDKYPGTTIAIPGGVNLLRHNTNYFKDMLSTKMNVPAADPGAFLMHADLNSDYIKHMTAEFKNEKGFWECPKGKDNHLWDCEALAIVAADFNGARYMKKKSDPPLTEPVGENKKEPGKKKSPEETKKPRKPKKRGMMY